MTQGAHCRFSMIFFHYSIHSKDDGIHDDGLNSNELEFPKMPGVLGYRLCHPRFEFEIQSKFSRLEASFSVLLDLT